MYKDIAVQFTLQIQYNKPSPIHTCVRDIIAEISTLDIDCGLIQALKLVLLGAQNLLRIPTQIRMASEWGSGNGERSKVKHLL